jgi:hypothetical protein
MGGKHLLKIIRKGRRFLIVTLGPASVRSAEWGNQYLRSFESIRCLPYGVVIRREGREIMCKRIVVGFP